MLRGINVGRNNVIRMADRKASLEGMGLREVTTYTDEVRELGRALIVVNRGDSG